MRTANVKATSTFLKAAIKKANESNGKDVLKVGES